MPEQTPTRRSHRERRRNPRYLGADWNREAIRRIRTTSESSGSSPGDDDVKADTFEDDYFDAAVAGFPDDISSKVENVSVAPEASGRSVSGGGEDEFERNGMPRTIEWQRNLDVRRVPAAPTTPASVGLLNLPRQATASIKLPLIFGPGLEDLAPIEHARATWLRSRDATLPSIATLSDPQSSFTFLQAEDKKRAEAESQRQPQSATIFKHQTKTKEQRCKEASHVNLLPELDETNLTKICHRQKATVIDRPTAISQKFLCNGPDHIIVAGPVNDQRPLNIRVYQCGPLQASATPEQTDGWLLNLGEKIQALSWAPRPGLVQYLAAATRSTPAQRNASGSSVPRLFGPAFTPSLSYPSSVQLWQFEGAFADGSDMLRLNTKIVPKLSKVICLRAGDIRQLKWAPTTSRTAHPSLPSLLAILSTDSHVRIVAVDFPDANTNTSYLALEAPVADIPPPTNPTSDLIVTGEDPVFSVISWLSTHELLVGTSNGLTFVYDILEILQSLTPKDLSSPSDPNLQLTPYHTLSSHQTYITALAPAFPILPNTHRLVASSSAAGDLALTCLYPSHPASTVISQRSRLPSRLLTYSPYSRSFLTVYPPSAHSLVDKYAATNTIPTKRSHAIGLGGPTLVAHHLRRFPKLLHLARLPGSGGAATTMAEGSMHHPCILIGNAGGEVWCTNYLRRCLAFRPRNRGRGGWILKIVRADWREDSGTRESEEGIVGAERGEPGKRECADLYHGPAMRKGKTRFVFGWKAMAVELGSHKGIGKATGKSGKRKRSACGSRGGGEASSEGKKRTRAHYAANDEILSDQDDDGDIDMTADQIEHTFGTTAESTAWTDIARTGTDANIEKQRTLSVSNNTKGKTKANTSARERPRKGSEAETMDTGAAEVVFEEEQAVTALDWSKDRQTAGWAAIGWGSGLVLVRDLSI